MKEGSGEGGGEDCCVRDWVFWGFGLEKEKGKSGEEAEHESGGERVKVSAIESEIGGRTEVSAEEVGVGNHPRKDDCDGRGAREARESGALQRIRGQGVSEGIHGMFIS